MRKSIVLLSVVMMVTFLAATAWGQNATKEECILKCVEAAELIRKSGVDEGMKAIGSKKGPFVWKDTYVFLMDMQGKMLAHPMAPQLTQKGPLLESADANGKLFFQEFIKVADNPGDGWIDYVWPKPGHKDPLPKSSYIYRVTGTDFFVGAGVYE